MQSHFTTRATAGCLKEKARHGRVSRGCSLGFLILSLALFGMALDASAKAFTASADKANVYVYRVSEIGTAVKFPAALDGKALGELPISTFILVSVAPGPHKLYVSAGNSKTLEFTAEPGRNVYVKASAGLGWLSASVDLTLMKDEKQAKQDLMGCNLIEGMQ